MGTIEAEALSKTYPSGVVAVDGIDLDVREGEIFGFLGPNGAGKSTTIGMLTTLLRPTSGRARVAGIDVTADGAAIRRRIGVALQEVGLDALSTGRELLILQARLHGLRGSEPSRRAAELLQLVGLTDAADRRIRTYSGGMKRRLDLASALIHGPRLLFLDEPTAGLDPASRETMWEKVAELNREEGVTVFLTTQYLEEADRLVDRVAIIDHGHIVAEGRPEDLKRSVGADVVTVEVPAESVDEARRMLSGVGDVVDIQSDHTRLTLFVHDGPAAVAAVIRALDAAAVPIGPVSVSGPTLDEVFLRATGSRLEGAGEPEEESA